MDMMSHKGKRVRQYTIIEKLKAVDLAARRGVRFASREMGVDERSVRRWREQEGRLKHK